MDVVAAGGHVGHRQEARFYTTGERAELYHDFSLQLTNANADGMAFVIQK
jgi:hypothetical protein